MESKTIIAEKLLGSMGRMVGGSKSIYRYDNPKNLVVFNSNVFNIHGEKLWYGDLDLTLDHLKLKKLSMELSEDLYVLYEMDGRFDNETDPKLANAVAVISGQTLIVRDSEYLYLKNGVPYQLTQKEIRDRFPVAAKEPVQYNEADYEPYELPAIRDLKGTIKKGSPLEQLQKSFLDRHGKEEATRLYRNLFISKEDEDLLEQMVTAYCKKRFPELHPVKVEQSVAMHMLDMSPSNFETTPTWARPGFGYIRKVKKEDE